LSKRRADPVEKRDRILTAHKIHNLAREPNKTDKLKELNQPNRLNQLNQPDPP